MSEIVSATGISANSLSPSGKSMAQAIQDAMSQAVLQAAEDKITDPDEIRERMMAARARVKAEWNAAKA